MRRMGFCDNGGKTKKGGEKKKRIDHAEVRSEHRSQHSRDKDVPRKENSSLSPRPMSRHPSLMLIHFPRKLAQFGLYLMDY